MGKILAYLKAIPGWLMGLRKKPIALAYISFSFVFIVFLMIFASSKDSQITTAKKGFKIVKEADEVFVPGGPDIEISKQLEKPESLPQPSIALVVGSLGVDPTRTELLFQRLPKETSLSFSLYSQSPKVWIERAHQEGFKDLYIDLPLEGSDHAVQNPGPYVLFSTISFHKMQLAIEDYAHISPHIKGFASYMGDKFLGDQQSFKTLMQIMSKQDFIFIDQRGLFDEKQQELAYSVGAKYTHAITHVDKNPSREMIQMQLKLLEEKAKSDQFALGVIWGYPVTLLEIASWSRKLEEKNIKLISVEDYFKAHTIKDLSKEDKPAHGDKPHETHN